MKKPAKISLGIVIIIGILFFFGLRTPLIVNSMKKQIKPGQSIEQVMEMLNKSGKQPDLCCWQIQGTPEPVCSDPKSCQYPVDHIQFNDRGQETGLTVLYMGPGFIHNDFQVVFNGDGVVESISDVKSWD